jgi:hypothetical protein
VPKIPFRLQISQFGLSDQNFGTPQAYRAGTPRRVPALALLSLAHRSKPVAAKISVLPQSEESSF